MEGFRQRAQGLLEDWWWSAALLVLLVLDICLVVVCGILVTLYISSKFNDCEAVVASCGLSVASLDNECLHPHYGNHTYHEVEHVLAIVSIGILCIFLSAHLLEFYVQGIDYFKHWQNIPDLFIVLVSLVLEIVAVSTSGAYIATGLVIIGRIWRFVRVGHGVIEGTHLKHDATHALATPIGHASAAGPGSVDLAKILTSLDAELLQRLVACEPAAAHKALVAEVERRAY